MRFSREVPVGDIRDHTVYTECLTDEQLKRAHEFLSSNLQAVKHEDIIVVVARVGATMAAWLIEQKAKEQPEARDPISDELGRDLWEATSLTASSSQTSSRSAPPA